MKTLSAGTIWAMHPGCSVLKSDASPNILLITADDMNYDSVGAFGCKIPDITPNIDRLASEGIRFTHAHVNIAVCQPCRGALMTGRYPHRNGAMGFEPINEDVPTLQEQLRAAGSINGICGKPSHLAPEYKFCWDRIITSSDLWRGRSPDLFYRQTLNLFNEAKKSGRPFFLMANSEDPHRPFPGSEQEKKRSQRLEENQAFPTAGRYFKPDEVEIPGFLPDLPDIRTEVAEYFTAVHRCDETIGQILRALEESGQADNTLVMFLSDNGMALPYAKTNCYLNSTKTPWIARWPGKIRPGSVDSEHMISTIDFMPTVLDALDLRQPKEMDGHSFLPLLLGDPQPERDKVFTAFHTTSAKRDYPMRCLQTKKYGYIFNAWSDGETIFKNESQNGLTFKAMVRAAEKDPEIAARVKFFQYRVPEELYDFEKDPNALNNLIGNPIYTEEVKKMRRELYAVMESTGDPLTGRFKSFLSR